MNEVPTKAGYVIIVRLTRGKVGFVLAKRNTDAAGCGYRAPRNWSTPWPRLEPSVQVYRSVLSIKSEIATPALRAEGDAHR